MKTYLKNAVLCLWILGAVLVAWGLLELGQAVVRAQLGISDAGMDLATLAVVTIGGAVKTYRDWRKKRREAGIISVLLADTIQKQREKLNTLYSPFTRFSEIAYEFMKSKDDPELLQNFTNSWLAEPWEDTRLKTNADLVMERQTDVPAWELPEWTKLLTGGIDVQENCLYWTIRAWGDFMTSQNVAHGQALSMAEVERVMNTEFKLPSGEKMMVELALMDSGDQTDEVYNFCISNYDWVRPCKGSSTPLQGHYRISTVDKAGSQANGMQGQVFGPPAGQGGGEDHQGRAALQHRGQRRGCPGGRWRDRHAGLLAGQLQHIPQPGRAAVRPGRGCEIKI